MSTWVRNLAMLVGLGGWSAVVIAYLFQGKLPDAILMGVPGALVLALAPPISIGRSRSSTNEETTT
ncbi:hypothetical protein [Micromonospora sp. NPDC049204]|uniref:hypothetical protein n=1 Tax=Micromonospora sp. NPDC049204 TaxID=3154351 RepID=UPI0033EE6B0D